MAVISVPTVFVYGTLRDMELLSIVSGDHLGDLDLSLAQLPAHTVKKAMAGDFPLCIPQKSENAKGLLIQGLSESALARLDRYEDIFEYRRTTVTVTCEHGDINSDVWMPNSPIAATSENWSLQDWQVDWGAIARLAAKEVMSLDVATTSQNLKIALNWARYRAASRVRALAQTAQMEDQVEIIHNKIAYCDFNAMQEMDMRHRKFDGSWSEVLSRSVMVAADAALVLPYDPIRDRVLLIRQIRPAVYARGDRDAIVYECIAGRIDPGETPEATAKREAQEEAGLELSRLVSVPASYPSPGTSTEHYYPFIAIVDLDNNCTSISGLEDEGEDIQSSLHSLDEALSMIDNGLIKVTPLQLMLLWLSCNRDALCDMA